ncbi:YecR family lipoprotein [Salinisphaera orenii]|uniref:YecR family lipoprotein n=2 Tax=Salinisphaera orenii TaxID=856731 RepID=UPI001C8341E5
MPQTSRKIRLAKELGDQMRLYTLCVLIAVCAISAGCASTKTLQATGGSRSDGVVEMSYTHGMFEQPQPEWDEAARTAADRCQAWGYRNAEQFGGTLSRCQAPTDMGCSRTLVTAKYQCTGDDNW